MRQRSRSKGEEEALAKVAEEVASHGLMLCLLLAEAQLVRAEQKCTAAFSPKILG